MAFANIEMVTGMLAKTGFEKVMTEEVDTQLTPLGAAADVTAMMLVIGPFRAVVSQYATEGNEDDVMDEIAESMTEGYGAFATPQGVRFPAQVIYYTARRAK